MERSARSLSAVSNVSSSFSELGQTRRASKGARGASSGFGKARRHRGCRRFHRRDVRTREKGGLGVGRCRAGNATKVMAIADRHGLPLAVLVEEGSRYDSVLTERTLDAAFVRYLPPRLIGDRAWDSAPLAERLRKERNIQLIAPTRSTTKSRKQDGRALRRYKRRWKVEALFARLKRWRRIATRWDFKADNFFGFVQLGCAILLLRALVGF